MMKKIVHSGWPWKEASLPSLPGRVRKDGCEFVRQASDACVCYGLIQATYVQQINRGACSTDSCPQNNLICTQEIFISNRWGMTRLCSTLVTIL